MNEQANQNATHGSLPKRNSVNVPVAASVNLNTPQDNTSGRIPGDDPAALHVIPDAATCKATVNDEAAASDHKDTTRSGPMRRLSQQFSRDSQKSGNTSQSVFYFFNTYNLQDSLILMCSVIVYCTCHLHYSHLHVHVNCTMYVNYTCNEFKISVGVDDMYFGLYCSLTINNNALIVIIMIIIIITIITTTTTTTVIIVVIVIERTVH